VVSVFPSARAPRRDKPTGLTNGFEDESQNSQFNVMSSNAHKVILSMCDDSGNWPSFYREAGYDVRCFDLKKGQDVRLLPYMELEGRYVHGILCAPVCTMFALSGNRHRAKEKQEGTYDEKMKEALALVDACLRAVVIYRKKLKFWVLENPAGTLVNYLGAPTFYFDPCDYGDPYTKRTALWGDFIPPLPLFNSCAPVEPSEGSMMWARYGGKSEATKTARSITPLGFAKAFFEANP
jgi:hypothetical protein